MKKILPFCLLAIFLVNCKDSGIKQNGISPLEQKTTEQIQRIDSLIQQLVLDTHTAGVSFGIQVNDAEPFVASYGIADIESQTKVNNNTIFSLASITKPILSK